MVPIGPKKILQKLAMTGGLGCMAAGIAHAYERQKERDCPCCCCWSEGYVRHVGMVSDRCKGCDQTRAAQKGCVNLNISRPCMAFTSWLKVEVVATRRSECLSRPARRRRRRCSKPDHQKNKADHSTAKPTNKKAKAGAFKKYVLNLSKL